MAARIGRAMAETGEVHTLRERYDPWTGRAWLEVRPSLQRFPMGPGYAEVRRALREKWPDRPFDADWADGRFSPSPFGRPVGPVVVLATVGLVALVIGAGAALGPTGAIAVGALGIGPVVRLLDAVDVSRRGLRVGPPWALVVPWHEVERVGIAQRGRTAELWMVGRRGASTGTIPAVLIPAVRARIRRMGGLDVARGDGGLDVRYARWRAPAAAIPWGVGLATLIGAAGSGTPWAILGLGGLVTLALVLLGAAVEARATGWGTGAIGWLTILYALLLLILGFASWV